MLKYQVVASKFTLEANSMKMKSSGITQITLGETTLIWIRGENVQHVSLPEGTVNIDPALSDIVTLGEANTLAITTAGMYMIVESTRFSRVDVIEASFDDVWKFLSSIIIDKETQGQIKAYAETTKKRLGTTLVFVEKVLEKLPKDGHVDRLATQLSKLDLRAAFREIVTAVKEAHPEMWEKIQSYASEPAVTFVESQIPEQKN